MFSILIWACNCHNLGHDILNTTIIELIRSHQHDRHCHKIHVVDIANTFRYIATKLTDHQNILTHWDRDKMDAISQTTFSNAFSWMKMYEYTSITISLKFAPNGPINSIPALVHIMAWHRPGPCITNVIATCRKNFSQWESSFLWKPQCHWLKFLRRVAKTLVIQGPGDAYMRHYGEMS